MPTFPKARPSPRRVDVRLPAAPRETSTCAPLTDTEMPGHEPDPLAVPPLVSAHARSTLSNTTFTGGRRLGRPNGARPLGARVYEEVVAVMPTGCQTSSILSCEC